MPLGRRYHLQPVLQQDAVYCWWGRLFHEMQICTEVCVQHGIMGAEAHSQVHSAVCRRPHSSKHATLPHGGTHQPSPCHPFCRACTTTMKRMTAASPSTGCWAHTTMQQRSPSAQQTRQQLPTAAVRPCSCGRNSGGLLQWLL